MKKKVNEGYCRYCDAPRNLETGVLKHTLSCQYNEATDVKYVDVDANEQVIIFCPYLPKAMRENETS